MTKAKDELAKQLREELAELATSLQGDSYYSVLPDELGDEHIKPFLDIITAHTNAEIARTLERIEAATPDYSMMDSYNRLFLKGMYENTIGKAIQAERAKLKEVK